MHFGIHSIHPIESMFAQSTGAQKNSTNLSSGRAMAQRWLSTTLLNAEKKFRCIKGYLGIDETRKKILQTREIHALITASTQVGVTEISTSPLAIAMPSHFCE